MSLYLNWFGKYYLTWFGLKLFDKENKWDEFSMEELELIKNTLMKSKIVKDLKKKGFDNKKIVKILIDKYDLLSKTDRDFEKTFGVMWPL